MADYHSTYKGPEGQTTQWDDIQRKMGNLPAKEPVKAADPFTPERDETKNKEWVDSKAVDELAELDDEFDDDRFLEQYRSTSVPPAVFVSCQLCALLAYIAVAI